MELLFLFFISMMEQEERYNFSYQAVAFLDVLGFRQKLIEFEEDSKAYESDNSGVFYSEKANQFIEIFNTAISKLNPEVFTYYLFSDNICITGRHVQREETLIDLLLVISELFYEFAKKGYFLRGGIDYGLFVDKNAIAIGIPLAKAYEIESKLAIFPRVVLSNNFVNQFKNYTKGALLYGNLLNDSLLNRRCEISYLNVFTQIFKVEDKEEFFETFSENIKNNLTNPNHNEAVYIKFEWLAREFNSFIDEYISSLAFLDNEFDPSKEFLDRIANLKIDI